MDSIEELLVLMARAHARVATSIWQDEEFIALSAMAQRVYFLALSQAGLSYCGVVSYTPRRWARLAGDTTAKAIERASAELADARFVIVDEETEELCIRTFVKHDGILKSPNLITAMRRDLAAVHSERIREGIVEGLPKGLPPDDREPFAEPRPKPIAEPQREPEAKGSRAHSAEPHPHPHPQSSSSDSDSLPADPTVENDDDDQAATQNTAEDQVVRAACELLAIGELHRLRADRPDLDNPPPGTVREIGWLSKATDKVWNRRVDEARKLLAENRHLDPQELAAAMAAVPTAPSRRAPAHEELTGAAARRIREENEARRAADEQLAQAEAQRRVQAEELLAKMSTDDRKKLQAEVEQNLGEGARRPVIESAMRSAVLERQAS